MSMASIPNLLSQQRHRLWVFGSAILLFVYAFWVVNTRPTAGLERPAPLLVFYLALFLLISVIDIESRRVPNVVVGPAAVVVLMVTAWQFPTMLLSSVLGGGAGFAAFLLIGMLRPGAMGGGDIKLAGLIGLIIGIEYVAVALLGGILTGGMGAAFFLITRRVTRKGTIAYAPYLCIGATITLLHGADIVSWYLG